MNESAPPAGAKIGLTPAQVAEAFPFHIALDAQLRVTQVGRSLNRLCPDVVPGRPIAACFDLDRPAGHWTLPWLVENRQQLFLLRHQASGVRLRGQMLPLPHPQAVLFIGSPWLTSPDEIHQRGLLFDDFAIHDPMLDLLQFQQAQLSANRDLHALMAKLTAQRAELRVVNEQLRRQAAEQRVLALIAARTDNAVVLTDAAGKTVWVNDGFTRLTGYTLDEVLGRTPGSVLQGPGTDRATVEHIRRQLAKGEGFSAELVNYHKSGRSYWTAIEVQPIRDQAGQITNFMAIESDVTARRAATRRLAIQYQVAQLLAESEDLPAIVPPLLQAICENLNWQVGLLWQTQPGEESLACVDVWQQPDTHFPEFIRVSRARQFARGEGLPGRILQSRQPAWIRDVTADSNFPRAPVAHRENLRGAFGFPILLHGKVFGVVEFFSRNIEEPDVDLLRVFETVGNHIGQFIIRKDTEALLLEANALQQGILDSATYSIIATAPDGTIRSFNAAAERLLGYAAAEMIGKATPEIIHDRAEVVARARELTRELGCEVHPGFDTFVAKARRGRPDEREWTYIRKDGRRFPVMLSVTALFDSTGRVTGYLGVASDITERKRWAEQLQAETEQLTVTLSTITTGVITVDGGKRVTLLNAAAERLTGWSAKEACGRVLEEVFQLGAEHDPLRVTPVDEVLATGQPQGDVHTLENQLILRDRDGQEHTVVASAAPMHNQEGRLLGVVLAFRDVTAELEADRLKRDFVSSVSHELRTPLTSIQGFIITILREPDMPAAVRTEFLQIVHDQSARLKNLVDDILEISRIESGRITFGEESVDLIAVARAALVDIEADLQRRGQHLATDWPAGPATVIGDAGKLRSVITNLLTNASKFTPDGGQIRLSLAADGEGVCLSVRDTGYGIPAHDVPRIFEKFYRVQRDGMQIQGTGLGLAIVKSIVDRHGGRIEVESAVNQGTSFRIHLPTQRPS